MLCKSCDLETHQWPCSAVHMFGSEGMLSNDILLEVPGVGGAVSSVAGHNTIPFVRSRGLWVKEGKKQMALLHAHGNQWSLTKMQIGLGSPDKANHYVWGNAKATNKIHGRLGNQLQQYKDTLVTYQQRNPPLVAVSMTQPSLLWSGTSLPTTLKQFQGSLKKKVMRRLTSSAVRLTLWELHVHLNIFVDCKDSQSVVQTCRVWQWSWQKHSISCVTTAS